MFATGVNFVSSFVKISRFSLQLKCPGTHTNTHTYTHTHTHTHIYIYTTHKHTHTHI